MSTTIEWVARPETKPEVWNVTKGCSPVSPGCRNCWAARLASTRLKHREAYNGLTTDRRFNGTVLCDKSILDTPLHWKAPRTVFVSSMGDLLHKNVPRTFIRAVFATIEKCPQHTFQVLTKRPARAWSIRADRAWPRNLWFGLSIESEKYLSRIEQCIEVTPELRFVSAEPLIGPIENLHLYMGGRLQEADWVIVGGESGAGARYMDLDWARSIRDQCSAANVPFFMKQLGTCLAKHYGLPGKGNDMAAWPKELHDLRVREWPKVVQCGGNAAATK